MKPEYLIQLLINKSKPEIIEILDAIYQNQYGKADKDWFLHCTLLQYKAKTK